MRTYLLIAISVLVLMYAPCVSGEHVYVVHGFGSNRLVMAGLCRFLEKNGYGVTNWGYNSISKAIPDIGKMLLAEIRKNNAADTVHFVTHSMGGLVVRAMLSEAKGDSSLPQIQRIVMLTPPNKGSELADFFSQFEILDWVLGPNLKHMRTDSASLANNLPVPKGKEVGIIAGARFDREGYNPIIDGDDDGFVSVGVTRLGTEKDFIVLPEGHVFIIHDKATQQNVLSFLRHGRFLAPGETKASER